jgi:hypothetical protein
MALFRKPQPLATAPGEIRDRLGLIRLLASRCRCRSYLEIGCNRNKLFDAVDMVHKVGVDPKRGGTHRMTSDAFFARNHSRFDLVMIDGLHEAQQVLRDVDNALAVLNRGGAIVLHDCNPVSEEAQRVPAEKRHGTWNGDVWKAVVLLRGRPEIDLAVGDFDYGCGVLLPRPNTRLLDAGHTLQTLTYADLEHNRREWLRLLDSDRIVEFIDAAHA